MGKKHDEISKLFSLILRHKPEFVGIELDSSGWILITVLLEALQKKGYNIDNDFLHEVVQQNKKKRFIISDDGMSIRANQGHSINVDLNLLEVAPPEILYHGTVKRFIESIKNTGLQKMSRNHVHLSDNILTAQDVASRRGNAIILEILSEKMHKDDFKFYLSENKVWLIDSVPVKYIKNLINY